MSIAENIARIRSRIESSTQHAGRDLADVTLMAVTKTFPPDSILEAYEAGLRVFGENRVQEFARKAEALRELTDARWHMIGHLQTNKVVKAAELFDTVDSVDSLKLAAKLNDAARLTGKKLAVLIEVNVGGEAAKSGAAPGSVELDHLLSAAERLSHLDVRGLMTVPPFTEDPQQARTYFRQLRELRDRIRARGLRGVRMDVLSMGMSQDFEIAIEEGSTCVRLGTAIFGGRQQG
jgi:pyridoxal phosphate enzyme (YggS family)